MIGERVTAGTILARVADLTVIAPFDGVLRGMMDVDSVVTTGMKIGDLDPRAKREYCFTISDKSLAIGGGGVEAVLSAPQMQPLLVPARTRAKP
jgi:xanthine dehydrogenase accessory factor